jgi:hypothetical protein
VIGISVVFYVLPESQLGILIDARGSKGSLSNGCPVEVNFLMKPERGEIAKFSYHSFSYHPDHGAVAALALLR